MPVPSDSLLKLLQGVSTPYRCHSPAAFVFVHLNISDAVQHARHKTSMLGAHIVDKQYREGRGSRQGGGGRQGGPAPRGGGSPRTFP